jgi:hypothetical protein
MDVREAAEDAFDVADRLLEAVVVLDAVEVLDPVNDSVAVLDAVAEPDPVADAVSMLDAVAEPDPVADAVAVFGNRSESVAEDVADDDAEPVVEDEAVEDAVAEFVLVEVAVAVADSVELAVEVEVAVAVHDIRTQIPESHLFDVQSEFKEQLAPRPAAKRRGALTSPSPRADDESDRPRPAAPPIILRAPVTLTGAGAAPVSKTL